MVAEWKPQLALAEVASGQEADGSGVYAALLSRSPIAKFEGTGGSPDMWGVFSHAEIEKAAVDTATFSSVTVAEGSPRILPLMVDPPEHAAYRRVINKFFGPAPIKAVEANMRPVSAGLLDAMVARGTADFAQEYAYQFAMRTLCNFLRVKEDWQIYNDWSSEMEEATGSGTRGAGTPLPPELITRIVPYVMQLIAERRANPLDDLISGFATCEVNGAPLDDKAIVGLVMAVILAGKSTTASGIGNLVLRLARTPELQQFLREHPDRIADAIEESLRIESPQQEMPRKATRDIEIAGETIRAGNAVFLNYGSANLDPQRWENPGKFDIDRKQKQHFAFGRGIHQCFGAPLARMQMRVTVEELLARTSMFELAGPVARRVWPRLSVEAMPLKFTPR